MARCDAYVERVTGSDTWRAWCAVCGWHGRRFRDEGAARASAEKHDGQSNVAR